jgi:hypothetical protein
LIGEKITINAEIGNNSDKEMARSEVVLKQTITYRTSRDIEITKNEITKILTLPRGPIPVGGDDAWNDMEILVPQIPPSNFLEGCGLISVNYSLVVR